MMCWPHRDAWLEEAVPFFYNVLNLLALWLQHLPLIQFFLGGLFTGLTLMCSVPSNTGSVSFFHCSSPRLCGEGFGKLHRRLCVSSAGLSLCVVIMLVTAVQSLLDHLIILLAGAKPHVSPAPHMTPKAQMIDFNPTTPDCDHTAISFFFFFFFHSPFTWSTTWHMNKTKNQLGCLVIFTGFDTCHSWINSSADQLHTVTTNYLKWNINKLLLSRMLSKQMSSLILLKTKTSTMR